MVLNDSLVITQYSTVLQPFIAQMLILCLHRYFELYYIFRLFSMNCESYEFWLWFRPVLCILLEDVQCLPVHVDCC